MHADRYRWTIFLVAITATCVIGCRGSKPFGGFVQISQEPESPFPEIDPPQQRLATNKPRTGDSANQTAAMRATADARAGEMSPHVDQVAQASSQTEAPNASKTTRSRQPDLQELAAQRKAARARAMAKINASQPEAPEKPAPTPKRQTPTPEPTKETVAAKAKLPSEKPVATEKPVANEVAQAAPATTEQSELMSAFSDYPPEVQREALRRLLAATTKTAQQTSQPSSLTSAIADTLDDLPTLPAASKERPSRQPARLATQAQVDLGSAVQSDAPELGLEPISNAAAMASLSDDSDSDSPVHALSDDVLSALESVVVQSLSDSSVDDKNSVQPVSASHERDVLGGVTRASLTPADQKSVLELPTEPSTAASSSVGSLNDQQLYKTLVARLSKAPAEETESQRASRLIKLRHLMVLSGNVDGAVEKIEGMSSAEQEFLRHQLLGLWTMVDPEGHPVASRRITTALPQLREATKFAAAATDSLDVRSLAFCTEIESYGQIKPFPGNRFDAGQQVILYCEIENFSVNRTDEGYETHLQGSYDIYNDSNQKVVSQLLPADKQVSANYLRDYFIAYQMHLPDQLEPGTYRLQLTMEDVSGKKYGQSSIPLEIAK